MATKTTKATDRAAGNGDQPAEPQDDRTLRNHWESLAARADAIRTEHAYEGELDWGLWAALEPLLREPIPAEYIQETPQRQGQGDSGLPYAATGIRSAQVQTDRMDVVLGHRHWRYLVHYPDRAGTLARCWVVVGNDLHWCHLDEHGELVLRTQLGETADGLADVLFSREGWGGFSRGKLGDAYKGSETNALKRVLARVGPGCEVYRLDFEDDPEKGPERPEGPPVARAIPAAESAPEPTEDEWQAQLDALLKAEGKSKEIRDLRVEAEKGMALLSAPLPQRVRELTAADGKRALTSLVARVSAALDAQDAPAEGSAS